MIKFLLSILVLINLIFVVNTNAQTSIEECNKQNLNTSQCIQYLQDKVREKQGEKRTLSSQIAVMDNQIRLTELRISTTKKEISDLALDIDTATKKIDNLEKALDNLTKVLINRIVATYEVGRYQGFEILLSSNSVQSFFSRLSYLKIAQSHDKQIIYQTQQAKNDYANQKNIFETKKKRAEILKAALDRFEAQLEQERKNKQALLEITKNDESRYQTLLAQALAERKAIVAAFNQAVSRLNSGEGEKTEKGKMIALVGNSGAPDCSSGSHLHFTILQNGSPIDPTQKLRDISPKWDNSPDGPFGFTGDWDWPISNPSITQGYGMTYWARLGWYGGEIHDGIDMTGGPEITVPKSGRIIYGSTSCDNPNVAGVSTLKYAAIKHDDDPSIISLYLHNQ